jgi:hypothetical protein
MRNTFLTLTANSGCYHGKMKILPTIAMLAAFAAAGSAYANCAIPDATVPIPDGATATKEEMLTAHRAVVAFDAAVKAYTDCLAQDLTDRIAAGGDKTKLPAEYTKLNDAQVDKVQQLADKFNTELKAYKAAQGTG